MSTVKTGICFPKNKEGKASTIDFNLRIIRLVLGESLGKIPEEQFVNNNKDSYRQNYRKMFVKMTKKMLLDRESALSISKKSLEFVKSELKFVSSDQNISSFQESVTAEKSPKFKTKIVQGVHESSLADKSYSVSYKNETLKGEKLCRKIEFWYKKGVMERGARDSLFSLATSDPQTSEKYEALQSQVFVLIGAGSAMGPYETLMQMGASVVALDVPREHIWKRLIRIAKNSPGGTLYYPVQYTDGKEVEGCDLLKEPSEILTWLKSLPILKQKTTTIGNYTYLDGALHVLLSAAADAIIDGVSDHLNGNVNVSFLCTPTDVSVVPKEAYYNAKERFFSPHFGRTVEFIISFLSCGKQLKPNEIEKVGENFLYNGLVVAQGPNYALAKMIQLWRMIVHYCENPGKISFNVAPGTATESVVHNRTFAWAFKGMPYFHPIEIFEQETSSSVMAGLMIQDILKDEDKKEKDFNPVLIKSKQAVHGGAWRCAYSQNTIGMTSVIVHLFGGPDLFLPSIMLFLISPILAYIFSKI